MNTWRITSCHCQNPTLIGQNGINSRTLLWSEYLGIVVISPGDDLGRANLVSRLPVSHHVLIVQAFFFCLIGLSLCESSSL